MSKILIVAEHDGAKLNASTAKCVTCASKIAGATIDVAVLAADAAAVAAEAAALAGVSKVLVVENPANKSRSRPSWRRRSRSSRPATRTCSARRPRSARTSCRGSRHCSA